MSDVLDVWVKVLYTLLGQGWEAHAGTSGIRIIGPARADGRKPFRIDLPESPKSSGEIRGVIVTLEIGGFTWDWEGEPLP